jgi:hypothetical protein
MFTLLTFLASIFVSNNETNDINNEQFQINSTNYYELLDNKINFTEDSSTIDEILTKIEVYESKSLMEYNYRQIEHKNELINVTSELIDKYNFYINSITQMVNGLKNIVENTHNEIKEHNKKINNMISSNYVLPKLNKITVPLGEIIRTKQNPITFEDSVELKEGFYYKDNLIIPITNNPYTEIYKLPCNFDKITLENKKILIKSEKRIALLPIEFDGEYIDLSKSNIQYFINTFDKCNNLKEIIYPESMEY